MQLKLHFPRSRIATVTERMYVSPSLCDSEDSLKLEMPLSVDNEKGWNSLHDFILLLIWV